MKTYQYTEINNWKTIKEGYLCDLSHLSAMNTINSNVKRILNPEYREIEKTAHYYMVEDMAKGGKTLVFKVLN